MLFFITRNVGTPDVCGLLHNSLLLSATHGASTEPFANGSRCYGTVCSWGASGVTAAPPPPPARLGLCGSHGSVFVCVLHVVTAALCVPGALPCLCVWLGVPSEPHRGRWQLQGARRCLGIAVAVARGLSGTVRSN